MNNVHPSLPKNYTLQDLRKIKHTSDMWLDHCDNWEDHEEITEFVDELQLKIDERQHTVDHLLACFALESE